MKTSLYGNERKLVTSLLHHKLISVPIYSHFIALYTLVPWSFLFSALY